MKSTAHIPLLLMTGEFFKAGKCMRGNKCKYSHDVEQARKVAKIDLYSDPRALDTIDKVS